MSPEDTALPSAEPDRRLAPTNVARIPTQRTPPASDIPQTCADAPAATIEDLP
jgi:hypothetical protein